MSLWSPQETECSFEMSQRLAHGFQLPIQRACASSGYWETSASVGECPKKNGNLNCTPPVSSAPEVVAFQQRSVGCDVHPSKLLDPYCNPYATARTPLQVNNTCCLPERGDQATCHRLLDICCLICPFSSFLSTMAVNSPFITLVQLQSVALQSRGKRVRVCIWCKCRGAFAELPPSGFSTSEANLTF